MHQISDEDMALFRHAMQGVKSLHCSQSGRIMAKDGRNLRNQEQLKLKRLNAVTMQDSISQDEFSDYFLIATSAEEQLNFVQEGVQLRQFAKLKAGSLSYAASLDLHGFTVKQARVKLSYFLQLAKKNDWRIVHIIHGKASKKGEFATLKSYLNGWLRKSPQVLAFCSCAIKDGGTGAIYLLLKRSKSVC